MNEKQTALVETFLNQVQPLVEKYSLELKKCAENHFQIKGKLVVNVYPTGKKYYIHGAPKGFFYKSVDELVDIAKNRESV